MRWQDAFREYLEENRDIIFDGGKDIIMHELDDAADGVAKQLTHALRSLARKVRGTAVL